MVKLKLPVSIERWREKLRNQKRTGKLRRRTDELRRKFTDRPSDFKPINLQVLQHNLTILPVVHGDYDMRPRKSMTDFVNSHLAEIRERNTHPRIFLEGSSKTLLRGKGEGEEIRKVWEDLGFNIGTDPWPIRMPMTEKRIAQRHLKKESPATFQRQLKEREIESIRRGRLSEIPPELLAISRRPIDRLKSWVMAAQVRDGLKHFPLPKREQVIICGWMHGEEVELFLRKPKIALRYYRSLPPKIQDMFAVLATHFND